MEQETKGETLQVISLYDIKEAHETIAKGHWFEPEAKRFFNSKWGDIGYLASSLNVGLFVSSERWQNEKRKYTIRAVNMATGQFISDCHWEDGKKYEFPELEFQRFDNHTQAMHQILRTNWTKLKRWL